MRPYEISACIAGNVIESSTVTPSDAVIDINSPFPDNLKLVCNEPCSSSSSHQMITLSPAFMIALELNTCHLFRLFLSSEKK